jgi:sporulation protein YlmC with PRC-barrel domain
MNDETSMAETDGHKTTIVVTKESGKILGNVNRVFIDPRTKKVSAVSFRRKYLGREYFLAMDQVEAIGEDVVFVRSEASPQPLSKAKPAPGEDLRNFQGVWVFSRSGDPIAAITDLGFDRRDWSLRRLFFCDNRALEVDAADVSLGIERIVVPDGVMSQVISTGDDQGLLARAFGRNVVDEAAIVLQRALRGIPGKALPGL